MVSHFHVPLTITMFFYNNYCFFIFYSCAVLLAGEEIMEKVGVSPERYHELMALLILMALE